VGRAAEGGEQIGARFDAPAVASVFNFAPRCKSGNRDFGRAAIKAKHPACPVKTKGV